MKISTTRIYATQKINTNKHSNLPIRINTANCFLHPSITWTHSCSGDQTHQRIEPTTDIQIHNNAKEIYSAISFKMFSPVVLRPAERVLKDVVQVKFGSDSEMMIIFIQHRVFICERILIQVEVSADRIVRDISSQIQSSNCEDCHFLRILTHS